MTAADLSAPAIRAQAGVWPPGGERWQEHARRSFHADRSFPELDPVRLVRARWLQPAGAYIRRTCALRDAIRG